MIITILSLAVVLAALFQHDIGRRKTGYCFIVPLLISELTYTYFTGDIYYYYSSLYAVLIVFLLYFFAPPIKLTLNLQKICIISIILNGIGLVIYKLNLQPDLYNDAFMVVYFITFLLFFGGRPRARRMGYNKNYRAGTGVYSDVGPVYRGIFQNKGEI